MASEGEQPSAKRELIISEVDKITIPSAPMSDYTHQNKEKNSVSDPINQQLADTLYVLEPTRCTSSGWCIK